MESEKLHLRAQVVSNLGDGFGSPPAETLGDRMKRYENETANCSLLDKKLPFMIRLDGHSFSKFTRSMQQPWDSRFMVAMVLTTYDLVTKFSATTGYTQSDEITLTFFPKPISDANEYPVLPFNGRIQKLTSLTAGYASARFNFHLIKLFTDQDYHSDMRILATETPIRSLDKILESSAHFDSRCVQFPSPEETFNCVLWRTRDAYKNVVSKVAHNFFGHKFCFQKNTMEKLSLILGKEPSYFETLHPYITRGVLVKKEIRDMSIDKKFVSFRFRMICTAIPENFTMEPWLEFVEKNFL